ncbi:hypothetical protein GCM10027594_30460 [Hymenobacter agri]
MALLLATPAAGQSLALFKTPLGGKLPLCAVLEKYVDRRQEFTYKPLGDLQFISSYANQSDVFGHWRFVVRHDSLNQYGFSSLELPITAGSYSKLKVLTDSAIILFTKQFGNPAKVSQGPPTGYVARQRPTPGVLRKAMWLIDGQKLTVNFSVVGEHGEYAYQLKIWRYQDFYENTKLPPWWDGF